MTLRDKKPEKDFPQINDYPEIIIQASMFVNPHLFFSVLVIIGVVVQNLGNCRNNLLF